MLGQNTTILHFFSGGFLLRKWCNCSIHARLKLAVLRWSSLCYIQSSRCLSKYKKYKLLPEPTWLKVKTWWQILPLHRSTYLRGWESASIEIPSFRPHFIKSSKTVFYEVNLTSQRSHLEVLLQHKFQSERGHINWSRFWKWQVNKDINQGIFSPFLTCLE